MDKSLLIVVSGISGAGKGTLCKHLCELQKDIKLSVSVTTRKPRPGEKEGENYFFISHAEFEQMIEKEKLLEYAEVYHNYYGTPKDYVNECLKTNDVILEIDPQGAMQIKKNEPNAVFLFVVTPTIQQQYERLKVRDSETEEQLKTRLTAAKSELDMADQYDYVIINDDLEKTVLDMLHIIESEKCRAWRRHQFIQELKESKFYD